ncbi:unnamed protein product [Cunninghamella blakesleeana]
MIFKALGLSIFTITTMISALRVEIKSIDDQFVSAGLTNKPLISSGEPFAWEMIEGNGAGLFTLQTTFLPGALFVSVQSTLLYDAVVTSYKPEARVTFSYFPVPGIRPGFYYIQYDGDQKCWKKDINTNTIIIDTCDREDQNQFFRITYLPE